MCVLILREMSLSSGIYLIIIFQLLLGSNSKGGKYAKLCSTEVYTITLYYNLNGYLSNWQYEKDERLQLLTKGIG